MKFFTYCLHDQVCIKFGVFDKVSVKIQILNFNKPLLEYAVFGVLNIYNFVSKLALRLILKGSLCLLFLYSSAHTKVIDYKSVIVS